jgi:hypothetical protein
MADNDLDVKTQAKTIYPFRDIFDSAYSMYPDILSSLFITYPL